MPPKEEKRVSARSSSRAAAADREGRGASKYDNNNSSTPNSANTTNNGGGDATTAAAAGKKTKKSRPTSRAPQLDPLLLARGMSARYLSSKLTNNNNVTPTPSTTTTTPAINTTKITPLDKNQIEKDLRHMEAYRNACNGYNQQLFVFNNQELVRSGYFGTFAPGVATTTTTSELNIVTTTNNNADKKSTAATNNNNNNNFSMPIKIDPEKEKSLSLLRKKIQSSEFTREKLETEYLSLRAHYVHESQLVRKTHSYEIGRWKFMMELMKRRGRVLALMRLKVAMSRDVEKLLGYRGELLEGVRRGEIDPSVIGMLLKEEGGGGGDDNVGGEEEEKGGGGDEQQQQQDVVDFIQMWNDVDAKLKEAELACIELETPTELLQMVQQSTTSSDDGDKGSGSGGGGSKRRKRSSSMDESGDIYNGGDSRNKKNPIPSGMEPHVIPWDCIVEPQTPYEVPILLSCLSSATDRALGYGKKLFFAWC